MGWLGYVVLGVAVSIWSLRLIQPSLCRRKAESAQRSAAFDGTQPAGSSKTALQKDAAVLASDDPPARFYDYAEMMESAYRNRKNTGDRKRLLDEGRRFFNEVEEMLPALRKKMGSTPELLPLKWLVIALEEDGCLEEALSICRKALEWRLEDGTKTGFAGRIIRIERRQKKEAS